MSVLTFRIFPRTKALEKKIFAEKRIALFPVQDVLDKAGSHNVAIIYDIEGQEDQINRSSSTNDRQIKIIFFLKMNLEQNQ